MKKNCQVCDKEFEACNNCDYGWRSVVCCREHFNFHMALAPYSQGMIDKATAKEMLTQAIEMYGEVKYANYLLPLVAEIMTDEPIVTSTEEEIITGVVENKHKRNRK